MSDSTSAPATADDVMVAKLTNALGRVEAGSVGGYAFRRHVVERDLLPLVKVLLKEARDQAFREYQALDERNLNSCIWIDPGRQSGQPCFGGTRVPVDMVMSIAEEAGDDAAIAMWPSVTHEHLKAGRAWKAASLG